MPAPQTPRVDRALPPGMVLTELSRIERSATFRRSSRHRLLLRHLVQRTLDGGAAHIKESVLAAEVFGRSPAQFDPRSDTTVRVEVRRLRQKLVRYYAKEGADSSVIVRIDPGSYVPRFEFQPEPRTARQFSLAVLPLLNLTGCARHDDARESLVEELIDTLVQVPGLRVVARRSVMALDVPAGNAQAVGAALGVDRLIEGSVQQAGDRLRIVIRLVDAADGIHRWSHAYEADSLTAADLVHRIARGVVAALELAEDTVALLDRAARRASTNADARDCWQRGRYLIGRHHAEAYRQAMQLFAQAVASDPGFALAWAGVGQSAIGLIGLAPSPDPALVATARDAVARALAIDPELAAAYGAQAFLAFAIDRDFIGADVAALTALRYAPADAYVHHVYAWLLTLSGRFDEAEGAFEAARELDPLDPALRTHQGLLWFYRRDFARAEQHFARVLEIEPASIVARVLHASAVVNRGDHATALAQFERIACEWPDDSIGMLGVVQALAMGGRMAEARAAFDAMVARFGADRVGPYRMAIAHARLGDSSAAFGALDRAAASADMNLVCLAVDPSFDGLRDLPQWPLALASFRLPDVGTDPRKPPDPLP
jgi:TolB-like protein/Flp pilus assembly protein TadD